MIKYRVLEPKEDGTKIEYGVIEGNTKLDLVMALDELKHKYKFDLKRIKLDCIQFDKTENL